mgnify:CR=1 FL=1
MLVNTKRASQFSGLTEYELRIGYKEGRYPALEIGRGERRKSLRWDLDLLQATLHDRMKSDRAAG